MLNKQKIVFLGGGNMAEAIFASLISNPDYAIEVIQKNPQKAARLKEIYIGVKVSQVLDYTLAHDDILVLAIKPQHAKDAILAIKDKVCNCIIISIMAGIKLESIMAWTNNQRLIRAMPNTPASIQKGLTAIYFSSLITTHEQHVIHLIFQAVGLIYLVQTESEIDKILPLTSSGIAFVYYFMESMINNAVNQLGFSEQDARNLVCQVIDGSIGLVKANPDLSISELRLRVTSKKGTTEQGILTLEQKHFQDIIGTAMQNSYHRCLELATEFS